VGLRSPIAPKPRRKHVKLGRISAAGSRLYVAHDRELAFETGEQLVLGSALKSLGEEGSSIRQNFAGEIGRALDEASDPQMIGFLMTGRIRRHVGEDHVGPAAEPILEQQRRGLVKKVHDLEFGAGQWLDFKKIDADDPAMASFRANLLHGYLRPSPWRGAEIDDSLALPQETVAGVDLKQLMGRAGPKTLPLGPCHIGIVELALEPPGRGRRAFPRGLDPRLERAAAFAPGRRVCHAETQTEAPNVSLIATAGASPAKFW
jgi:hypothetical protein